MNIFSAPRTATLESADSPESLRREIYLLRERVREAEETLEAIRNGDVDAVVVSGTDDVPRIYTLETADETYRLLVEEMQGGALTLTRAGDILYCNAKFAELVQMQPERVIGGSLQRFLASADWPAVQGLLEAESKGEIGIETDSGCVVPTHISFSALRGGALRGEHIYCCIVTDLTEQRRTADQLRATHAALLAQVAERERTERLLRQSQKMEAIGQLTGGIAHDFNNLLMVITGGLSILDRNPPPERRDKLRDGMRQAAQRGATLTRQLLAFSRQKELHAKPIAVPRHVEGMRELLDSSLGGAVTVNSEFAPDVWPICVDEGELESALLNLCVNARDAMPNGGTVTIAARNRPNINEFELRGDFVEVSVTDTGEGMDAETISRCLEPFYTTKEVGKGSGLGLAQVYGFAQGSDGTVQIESKLGQGTRVSLLLPRSGDAPRSQQFLDGGGDAGVASPHCRVLLVEDDAAVASLTADMLLELGYDVIQVADAQAALNTMADRSDIGLILSDVMMPGMDGLSFLKDVRRRYPELPVVLVTGFPEAVKRVAQRADIPLLPKPYTLADLAARLESVLAR